MKKYLLSLAGLALLGGQPLLAQGPPTFWHGPGCAPVGAPPVVGPDGASCLPGGCLPTKTVCVPEQYAKKTTHWVYNSRCEPLCLCYYRGLFKHCGGCDKSGHCERPYMRKYMVKKARPCEEPATKCVPAQVPACAGGYCPAGPYAAGAALPAPPALAPGTVYAPGAPAGVPGMGMVPRP